MARRTTQRRESRANGIAILVADGRLRISTASRNERSTAGRYWNAVHHFLATGDGSRLEGFQGVTVAGHELLTDLDLIELHAHSGELDFESIYGSVR